MAYAAKLPSRRDEADGATKCRFPRGDLVTASEALTDSASPTKNLWADL